MQFRDRELFYTTVSAVHGPYELYGPSKSGKKKTGERLEQASSRSVQTVRAVKPISPSNNKSEIF